MTDNGTTSGNTFAVMIGDETYSVERVALSRRRGESAASRIDPNERRILVDDKLAIDEAISVTAAAVATAWQQVVATHMAELDRAWTQFDAVTDAVDHDLDGEVDEDHAGDLFAAYHRLARLGVKFDPGFKGTMVKLADTAHHVRDPRWRPPLDRTGSESFADGGTDDGDSEFAGYSDGDEMVGIIGVGGLKPADRQAAWREVRRMFAKPGMPSPATKPIARTWDGGGQVRAAKAQASNHRCKQLDVGG